MATTKRRSPTSTLVSKSAISQASSILEDLPEKPKEIWSLREAIELLKDPITAALDRGYSYPEVSKMLSERGVEISASTLKYYLSAARKEKDPNKPRTRRQRRTLGVTANGSVNGVVESIDSLTDAEEKPAAKPKGRRGSAAATGEPAAKPARKTTTRRTTAKAKADSEASPAPKAKAAPRAKAAPKAPTARSRKKAV
jgi:hypothetical protein